MAKLIVRRVIWTIPVLLLVVFLTFILMKAIPGGPFTGEKALPPEILANMNAKYGLDAPWYEQYLRYIWRALHGDLGVSMTQKSRTVLDIISDAFPVSLHPVSYTHLRAHETKANLVCRLLLEKKKKR